MPLSYRFICSGTGTDCQKTVRTWNDDNRNCFQGVLLTVWLSQASVRFCSQKYTENRKVWAAAAPSNVCMPLDSHLRAQVPHQKVLTGYFSNIRSAVSNTIS